jgi:hypothetical protein
MERITPDKSLQKIAIVDHIEDFGHGEEHLLHLPWTAEGTQFHGGVQHDVDASEVCAQAWVITLVGRHAFFLFCRIERSR